MTTEDGKVKSFLSSWGLPARPCDSCRTTAALIFCRIDSVFLCISCDTRIHKLASGHERVWMCEVCEQAPASVTCKADVASLCVKCDRDIHSANPLSRRHERFPVVPFSDSAAEGAIAKSTMSGTAAAACDDGGDVDTWLIPNPSGRLSVEFLLSDADPFSEFGHESKTSEMKGEEPNRVFSSNNMTDSVVPNQSKSRSMNFPFNENCYDIDFTRSKVSTFSYSNQCVSSSDAGVVPDRGNSSSISDTSDFSKSMSTRSNVTDGSSVGAAAVPLSRVDREARVLRYREKRKNRKFEKTIRYASRKAYAETRPRIKGRFAKRTKTEMMMDGGSKVRQIIFGSNNGSNDASLFDHGVVPSFCL